LSVTALPNKGLCVMTVEPMSAVGSAGTPEKLRIEFLFLDLTTCTHCLGADRGLETALDVVREVLDSAGVEVEVDKVLVTSGEQARALCFVSSPTIRVDGRDGALELRESSCGSEACTDGCGDHIACRVWVYRGREYTEPPVAMIVDAILRRVYSDPPRSGAYKPEAYELPENLARFFAGKTAAAESACCEPAEQETCCAPEAKADCCGADHEAGCGCR
jgi:Domain of unknown function (DUF2703)